MARTRTLVGRRHRLEWRSASKPGAKGRRLFRSVGRPDLFEVSRISEHMQIGLNVDMLLTLLGAGV